MGGKVNLSLEEKEVLSKPGPGQYDPNPEVMKKQSPKFKVGTAMRDDLSFKKQNFKPSPNLYNPSVVYTKS